MKRNKILDSLFNDLKDKNEITEYDVAVIFESGWKTCKEHYNVND